MTRRWPCIILATLWFALAPTPVLAVLDGTQWRALPESGREAYVTGVVDTWSEISSGIKTKTVANPAYAQGAVETLVHSVSECAQPMTYGRIIAIVEKYMNDHPEAWQHRMASNVFAAIQASCSQ